jgi:hypothetical protein
LGIFFPAAIADTSPIIAVPASVTFPSRPIDQSFFYISQVGYIRQISKEKKPRSMDCNTCECKNCECGDNCLTEGCQCSCGCENCCCNEQD